MLINKDSNDYYTINLYSLVVMLITANKDKAERLDKLEVLVNSLL